MIIFVIQVLSSCLSFYMGITLEFGLAVSLGVLSVHTVNAKSRKSDWLACVWVYAGEKNNTHTHTQIIKDAFQTGL